jgi:release factor glutamine methyltransferase
VARRVAGEPLEHLLGWASFHGLRVVVTPGVFVPRRRSELLVDLVVGMVRTPVVLDLCCGSGAIGAAIGRALPEVEVWGADVDPVAVACARQNLPPERVRQGDLYDALPAELRGQIDVVAVNAPYVPTDAIATMPPEAREHEPRVALDGGADGLDLHRRVLAEAGPWLAPGGAVVIETSGAQAEGTVEAAHDAGLHATVEIDDDRDATAVVAVSPR